MTAKLILQNEFNLERQPLIQIYKAANLSAWNVCLTNQNLQKDFRVSRL